MAPKKRQSVVSTRSSVDAPTQPLQVLCTGDTVAASASPGDAKPGQPPHVPRPLSEVQSSSAVTSSRYTTWTMSASSAAHHVRMFYRTGMTGSTPPHTLMDMLRLYVDFFVFCAIPTMATQTNTATVGGHREANINMTAGGQTSGNGRHGGATASVKAEGGDPVAQVTALTLVSIPYRILPFLESVTLLPEGGEATVLPPPVVEVNGRAARRKRHRSSVEADGRNSVVSDENAAGGNGSDGVSYQPDAMLQRLREYGTARLPGFDSDSAYLAAKDMLLYMKHYSYLASGMALNTAVIRKVELAGLEFCRQCVPCIDAITELLGNFVDAQVHKMRLQPRVLRLSERLCLSAKAVRTFEYLLLCHCGRYFPGGISDPLRPASIAHHNDLTPQELLSILSETSALWKQGLIFTDIKMNMTFMDYRFALPTEVIAALSGDQLSEEQLIKLERTSLLEVLNEEERQSIKSSVDVEQARLAKADTSDTGCASHPLKGGHEGSDTDNEEDDDATVGSAMTLPDEMLDDVFDQLDTAMLTAKKQSDLQEAILRQLGYTPSGGDVTAAAVSAAAAAAAAAAANSTTDSDVKDAVEEIKNDDRKADEPAVMTPSTGSPASEPLRPGDTGEARTTTPAPCKTGLTLADINPLAQRNRNTGTGAAAALSSSSAAIHTDSSLRGVPYETNIEYMDASFRILANLIRIRYAEGDMKDDDDSYTPKSKVEAAIRELKGKVRVAAMVHASRLQATFAAKKFTPRIEQLAQRLGLTEMEKQIMLFMVGNVISHDMLVAVNGRYGMREGQRLITVGYMLFVLCETLEERVVARRAFYQSAALVANGILSLSLETSSRTCFNTELMDYLVDIDRKIVDDVMGITAETAEMVPGSQLYFPEVVLENVILPSSTMDRVLSTIEHYSLFEECKKGSGFGDGLGTSKGGLVMLFHGPSGTGKTMLANAVAHHLHKKILLVSVVQFRSTTKSETDALRFLFREAKLSDAIIFFDECESLFEDRTTNSTLTALLSEFERYDGLIILATNRAQNFDEAMNRRISLMMEFRPPDHQLRLRIWKSHLPRHLQISEDVCLEKLALNYELSGGLIRNAVLAALSRAVAREKSATPRLTMNDLDEGARQQLRGFFLAAVTPEGMSEFYLTPKRTLAELVVEPGLRKNLEKIASCAKSRSTLYTEWGFNEDTNDDCGMLYLFQGVSGTGKSLAAEGIAYECGATVRLCNVAELLLREEMRVHSVFEEGRRLGAIIVFDEAQVLFNESAKSLQLSQLIQYHSRRYPRPIIVIATTAGHDGSGGRNLFSTTSINSRSTCMFFKAELTFTLPDRSLREQLWRRAFPERVPTADNVDYGRLSAVKISPKLIRAIAFNVCCSAALLPVMERVVTMAMIEAELESTVTRDRSSVSTSAMFA